MWLLFGAVIGSAEAVDYVRRVPQDSPTLGEAYQWATDDPDGGGPQTRRLHPNNTVTILLGPGMHQVPLGFIHDIPNANLTISGTHPPREVDDPHTDSNTYLTPGDWLDEAFVNEPTMMMVADRANFTLRNVMVKAPEMYCKDKKDNDGNGIIDKNDPFCLFLAAGMDSADTAVAAIQYPESRVLTAVGGSNVTVENVHIQGMAFAEKGAAVLVEDSTLTVNYSLFAWNEAVTYYFPQLWWENSQGGAIYAANSTVLVQSSRFEDNLGWYGGAIYLTEGSTADIWGSLFERNGAHDGGAIAAHLSVLNVRTSTFFGNFANVVPPNGVQISMSYDGGAIFTENSDVLIRNNVFAGGYTHDQGAALYIKNSYYDGQQLPQLSGTIPLVKFNTFYANTPQEGAGVVVFDNTEFEFNSNILSNSVGTPIVGLNYPVFYPPVIDYNDFWASSSTELGVGGLFGGVLGGDLISYPVSDHTNIAADPLYANANDAADLSESDRFNLWAVPASPTIDAGDPAENDPGGSRADMGAYGGMPDIVDITELQLGFFRAVFDGDGDGWTTLHDCNDTDDRIHPYAAELCNNLDDDCNGTIDDFEQRWYPDRDYDGHGDINADPADIVDACPGQVPSLAGGGVYVGSHDDCDDTNPRVSPGTPEYCDGIDNNCNLNIDEGILPRNHWPDRDRDGFGNGNINEVVQMACAPGDGSYSPFGTDCNDGDDTIYPLITQDARLHLPLASRAVETSEASRSLSFVADAIDQDCDGGDLCYADADGDGYGAANTPGSPPQYEVADGLSCANNSGTSTNATDCHDGDALAFPGSTELVGDGRDQNCDGADLCYEDLDGDGYGSDRLRADDDLDCNNDSAPTSSRSGDCLDAVNAGEAVNPNQIEQCDGLDNNCNGEIDENAEQSTTQPYYQDLDGDGFGNIQVVARACSQPLGYSIRAGDCDDTNQQDNPDGRELCDGRDNDCDTVIDGPTAFDVLIWYVDADDDGYGDNRFERQSCEVPSDGQNWVVSGSGFDCDDADPEVGPCTSSCSTVASPSTSRGMTWIAALAALAMLRRRRAA